MRLREFILERITVIKFGGMIEVAVVQAVDELRYNQIQQS